VFLIQGKEAPNDQQPRKPQREPLRRRGSRPRPLSAVYGWLDQGSGAAFAAVFAEDGDLVAFDGTHFKGREEIAPFHQQLFDKWLKGSRLVGQVKDVRFLSPDVALMHAVGGTVMRGKSEPSPERDSIQTLVATRQEDGDGGSLRSKTLGSTP
jgi:uncharacterized protein (TIGR02246 family)